MYPDKLDYNENTGKPGSEQNSTEASCYLLPCPFCGGKAEFFTTSSDNGEGFDIGCYTDSCIMRSGSDVQYNTKQSAAKEWNTRIFADRRHEMNEQFIVDLLVIRKNFLNDLKALLGKYDAEIVVEDHWTGYAECGQDVRMTVEFENWKMEDLDLGRYVDKEKHGGV